jgi:thiol-disulfide isomerase/thioredoxin
VLLLLLSACGVERPTRPEFKPAPEGEVASVVTRAVADAHRDHRRLLVYVGATWCEPCRRFHQAIADGKLDAQFPDLRFLEFDLDKDQSRLVAAGYQSRLIPLFANPGPDGRASGRQMEGSIKGDGAVGEIVPRLTALLR